MADVDMDQLSSTQQEALQQYIAVTDQDIKDAVPLLERSEWNVQVSLYHYGLSVAQLAHSILTHIRSLLPSSSTARDPTLSLKQWPPKRSRESPPATRISKKACSRVVDRVRVAADHRPIPRRESYRASRSHMEHRGSFPSSSCRSHSVGD